jgi:predicted RND superfamily exporter protein
MQHILMNLYRRITLQQPLLVWLAATLFIALSAWFSQQFELDASADSLVLEGDDDLRYYRAIRARYGSDDFLFVTYTPPQELFSVPVLESLKKLRNELRSLDQVEAVTTILDVPLIDSPRVSLNELSQQIRTLEQAATDRQLARREFLTSPLYSSLLLSPDGKTTAMMVELKRDEQYEVLLKQREMLREKQLHTPLSADENLTLDRVSGEFAQLTIQLQDREQQNIADVRRVLEAYRSEAEIHLGGVPMISSDMIDFVRSDIRVFGIGVALFLIALLSISFKRLRWILVPMAVCATAVIGMVGYLGLMEWRVTVVSSNFISLLLIITLSLMVHLVVRFQELQEEQPNLDHRNMLGETMRSKLAPSFYTAATTMVAFGSLVVSDIRPVIDFGWMMVVGVGLAFVLAFALFPALLARMDSPRPVIRRHDITAGVTRSLGHLVERFSLTTLLLYVVVVLISILGISRLSVENRFIDYFKQSTEIHQGMLLIDKKLGGTTPLDVILDPDREFLQMLAEEAAEKPAEDDPYMKELDQEGGISADSFWFNIFQLEDVDRVHAYLDSLPETGKVISLSTTMAMLTQLNGDSPLDNFTLSVMHKRLPAEVKQTLFDPYMSEDGNQVRFGIRVIDSDVNLQRDALLNKIRSELVEKLGMKPEQVQLSGMLVLYNNVLQSLFRSQIMTLAAVFVAIVFMFLLLFRSLKLALIGVVPTAVAASLILGLMGWLGIPLDIMTITIAAITIGIGVDDTIHYIHRFREEFALDGDYRAAMRRSHASVGRAIYYTSITITLGFSILVLSNFIPTIYFGLLTGFAMIIALVANLTLLPLLLVKIRPLNRPEGPQAD